MVELCLYVEGGGDSKHLRAECRRGFATFIEKLGMKGRMPKIVACGSRLRAFDDFCTALRQGKHGAMLLVDSEDPVTSTSPWTHLSRRQGDQWQAPLGAKDDDCHLMVQCMENWFLADRSVLMAYFGQGFDATKLPAAATPLESIDKASVYDALRSATRQCKTKAPYGKGAHSFELLARIDAAKVVAASRWAGRFRESLIEKVL